MRRDQTASATLTQHLIRSAVDPWFATAFKILNDYFSGRGEMETQAVIEQRFNWDPAQPENGVSLSYEMAVLLDDAGDIVAVGDYSVILQHAAIASGAAAVVHLSHVYANPQKPRRDVLNKYVPELTAQAARLALHKAGLPATTAITLAAEMEPFDAANDECCRRIRRFLLAGLCMVDPATIHFYQPDFRAPAVIDASSGAGKLLLTLMLRRLGREAEEVTVAAEIRHIVECLYRMYAQGIRVQDMAPALASLHNYPHDTALVRLRKRV
jgi:hypothetical protein